MLFRYLKNILICFSLLLIFEQLTAQVSVFNPAEFEKNEGVMLVWDYSPSRDSVTANIVKAAQTAAKVWIVYYPGQAPADTNQIRNYLYSRGVTADSLYFIPAYTETLWIRDFGPMTLYGNFGQGSERYILDMGYSHYNRPKDDSIPAQLSNLWNWQKNDLGLQIEGGNLIFDGLTRGFASTRVYEQNPEYSPAMIRNILIDKFNQMDFVFLQSLDHSGGGIWKHVDMFMKVLDYETILVSSYPDNLPDYPVIESNVAVLEGLLNHFGKPYKIIRVPAPPKADGTYATSQDDEMRTYTNSLIINNTVIMPSYGLPYYDSVASKIYADAMPGYKIIQVNAQQLTILGGAIHCITKEVPAETLVRIVHRKVEGPQPYAPEMYIYSNCESNESLQGMWLYYKVNDDENYTKIPVYMACPQNIGIIENLKPSDRVRYYLEGVSNIGSSTYPGGAPAAHFTFWLDEAVATAETQVKSQDIKIVPNPNNGSFYVHHQAFSGTATLEIFDLRGQLVFKSSLFEQQQLQTHLPTGLYQLRLKGDFGSHTTKMVIIN